MLCTVAAGGQMTLAGPGEQLRVRFTQPTWIFLSHPAQAATRAATARTGDTVVAKFDQLTCAVWRTLLTPDPCVRPARVHRPVPPSPYAPRVPTQLDAPLYTPPAPGCVSALRTSHRRHTGQCLDWTPTRHSWSSERRLWHLPRCGHICRITPSKQRQRGYGSTHAPSSALGSARTGNGSWPSRHGSMSTLALWTSWPHTLPPLKNSLQRRAW